MAYPLNLLDWYWQVGEDTSQFYSSARGIFVPNTDATFVAFQAENSVIKIDTIANLGAELAVLKLRPNNTQVLAAYQQASASAVDLVIGRVLFNHENRIRALEAKAPITAVQFTAAIAALL